MKYTGLLKCAVVLTLLSPVVGSNIEDASAINFKGQEEKYYKICSSSRLSASKMKTCKKFNNYLKKKSASIKKDISSSKDDISDTKASITKIQKKIEKYETQIKKTQEKIAYVEKTITNTEKKLAKKEEKLKERIYSTQTGTNSSTYLSYLLAADSFTDFFSRVSSLSDVTSYEADLMKDIKDEKEQLETQKKTLSNTKATLKAQKEKQKTLNAEYEKKLKEQEKELRKSLGDLEDNEDDIKTVARKLREAQEAADATRIANLRKVKASTQTVTKKVKVVETDENGNKKTVTKTVKVKVSSSKLGVAIANKALSKQGCRYVYGACHSMSQVSNPSQSTFDCSGLVSWAHYQAGVNIGAQSTATLRSMGKAVSRSNLQIGDTILFGSSAGSIHHTGIYVGNNNFVHAPCAGKPVQVSSLTGYYASRYQFARRIY